MNDGLQPDSFMLRSDQGGVQVVRLLAGAVEPSVWPAVVEALRKSLPRARQGLVIDCRALPNTAAEIVGPALYGLLLAGRKCSPRVELTVVGQPAQTITNGSAFLLPTRFETVEAAAAALAIRQGGQSTIAFARDYISDVPIQFGGRPRYSQTALGQLMLVVLVMAVVGGSIWYSARASFGRPVPIRHRDRDIAERAARIAVQGTVRAYEGRVVAPDVGAVILAWPAHQLTKKSELVAKDVFEVHSMDDSSLDVVASTDIAGRYMIEMRQLSHLAAPYWFLAISKQRRRTAPPSEEHLKTLAERFDDPRQLLGNHQYALQELFVDANVTKDQDFVMIDAATAPPQSASASGTASASN